MSSRQLVTRRTLTRELALNAATKPLALGVGAAVAAAAFVIGTGWLLVVAVAVYVGLVLATFFDGDEAERVGKEVYARARESRGARALPVGLDSDLASLVERARTEERKVLAAAYELGGEFDTIAREVNALASEMERIAPRAQTIASYLREQPAEDVRRRLHALRRDGRGEGTPARDRAVAALTEQLRVNAALEAELEEFRAEMEHLIASLGVIHAQLVRMSVAGETANAADVAGQLGELRERVGVVSAGVSEAAADVTRSRES